MSGGGPLGWLRDLIGVPSRPRTRLSEVEALQLARFTAARAGITDDLEVMDVRQIKGRLCWVVGTATKDAGWTVIVDDQIGTTGQPEAWDGWSASSPSDVTGSSA